MDLFVDSYKTPDKEPIIDFKVSSSGELITVSSEAEIKQRAIVASFTQKGTIPQLPNTGVEWAQLLTGDTTPAEINSQVMKQMHECANTYAYLPKYLVTDGKLYVTIE